MQDTSPTASQRPEPIPGRDADDVARVDVTWYENLGAQPVDNPLIALIPIPELFVSGANHPTQGDRERRHRAREEPS